MANIHEFEADLDAFAKQVGIDYNTVVKRVAFELFTRIVRKTPVDTGRARASWNIAIGEPVFIVAPEGQQPSMNTWSAEAKATTALVTLTERSVITDAIWITNNLPYIVKLEEGHSKQAPAGMVAVSIMEVTATMNALIKVL